MIARVREWCRTESLGITVPVGFVALWVLWDLLRTFSRSFVYPILLELGDDPFDEDVGLSFTIFDVNFHPDTLFVDGIAAFVLVLFLYWMFWRRIPEERETSGETRECPECLSKILADARRCAFCTAEVAPLAGGGTSGE